MQREQIMNQLKPWISYQLEAALERKRLRDYLLIFLVLFPLSQLLNLYNLITGKEK